VHSLEILMNWMIGMVLGFTDTQSRAINSTEGGGKFSIHLIARKSFLDT
jgi:hypothetical protein